MLVNGKITIYHKDLDTTTRKEIWTKKIYNAWNFGGNGAGLNKGYADANNISIRIPYDCNENANISDFAIGDIIYIGEGIDIESQNDLDGIYNITSIVNNLYGPNKHIHIEGK